MVRALTAVFVTAVVLAGCGGSDAPTQAEFVRQVAAVCRTTVNKAAVQPTNGKSPAGVEVLAERVAAVMKEAAGRFESLKAPDKLQDRFTRYTTEVKGFGDAVGRYGVALRSHSRQQANVVYAQIHHYQASLRVLSRPLGIKPCI